MTFGVLEVDGVKLEVIGIRLHKGVIEVTAHREVYELTEIHEGSRFRLYGEDGAAVAEGPFRHPYCAAHGDPDEPEIPATMTVTLPIRINQVV